MFEHWLFTLGLFVRMRSKVVPVSVAIDWQLSPETTTWVTSQSWPMIPRHSSCNRNCQKRIERSSQRLLTSPGNKLVQSALMVALFTEASWKLETFSLAEISSQVSPATTV